MYSELLKDPRWQKKRLHILERDGWSCQCCERKDKTLHVHHLKYFGSPWDAEDRFLETLCEDCHEARTLFDDAFGRSCLPTGFCVMSLAILNWAVDNDQDFVRENFKKRYSDIFPDLRKRQLKHFESQNPVASPAVV